MVDGVKQQLQMLRDNEEKLEKINWVGHVSGFGNRLIEQPEEMIARDVILMNEIQRIRALMKEKGSFSPDPDNSLQRAAYGVIQTKGI